MLNFQRERTEVVFLDPVFQESLSFVSAVSFGLSHYDLRGVFLVVAPKGLPLPRGIIALV